MAPQLKPQPQVAADAKHENEEPTPTFQAAVPEGKVFDQVTAKGAPEGLFQACMKAIRSAHFRSNRIRAFLVITGLFTDRRIWRDVMAIFYLLTQQVEAKLEHLAKTGDPIAQKIRALGYRLTEAYEKDLEFLFRDCDKDFQELAQQTLQKNAAAVAYMEKIQSMTGAPELAGAAFVLMGALIIGGGAAAMPRVKSSYGPEATHLFQPVSGPGREQRKRAFIECFDSLAEPGSKDFETIVTASQECMQGNNNVLSTLARNPWWLPYATAGAAGALSIAAYFARRMYYKN